MNFAEDFRTYRKNIESGLRRVAASRTPRTVYEPIRYVLGAGGKRVRPIITLLACEAVGGRAKDALNAALAVEILHTFTLVHDDIMDRAGTRRGRPTIHKKWDTNVAILAGDQMIALAYHTLLKTKSPRRETMLKVFTDAFIAVCEGQGYDKEFEDRDNVSVRAYMNMIDKKTGRIMSCAAALGALAGGGGRREVRALAEYGTYIGRAFQLNDDVLDVFADSKSFGKAIGGDLKLGKKTYLLLRALERVRGSNRSLLRKVIQKNGVTQREVVQIRRLFEEEGILDEARRLVRQHTNNAHRAIAPLRQSKHKQLLLWLADGLVARAF